MRIGSTAGTVCTFAIAPPANTRGSANSGRKRATGSLSSKRPSSHSIIAATDVIGLVIEKIRHSVSSSTGAPASRSRRPAIAW